MNLKMSACKRMEKRISLGSDRFLVRLNLWIVYRTVWSSNSIDILPQRWTFRRFRRFPQQLIVPHSLVTKLYFGSSCLWHLPGFARAAFLITQLQSPNGRSQWPHSEPLPSRPVERDVRVHHRIQWLQLSEEPLGRQQHNKNLPRWETFITHRPQVCPM